MTDLFEQLLMKANHLEIELAASENNREALERDRDELVAACQCAEVILTTIGNLYPLLKESSAWTPCMSKIDAALAKVEESGVMEEDEIMGLDAYVEHCVP